MGAPRYLQAWKPPQMVSSMSRALWRSQPWTLSSVMGPGTTSPPAEQMGTEPDRARQSQRKTWSPSQLCTFSLEKDSSRCFSAGSLGQAGWMLGPAGSQLGRGYRPEVRKSHRQPTRQK